LTASYYRSPLSDQQDAHLLGLSISKAESGQSRLQGMIPHKPPHSMGRSLTINFLLHWLVFYLFILT